MNRLSGHISAVRSAGQLSIATVHIGPAMEVSAVVIETPETATYLEVNYPIDILFKETEVILSVHEKNNTSIGNQVQGELINIETGELLSRVVLRTRAGEIVSIIDTDSLHRMKMEIGQSIFILIKLNEIMLAQR